jgi:MFS family permease
MRRWEIWAIGCGQLVNWGVLYFAFGVLLLPLEQSLGSSRTVIAGAFSIGLLISAAAAPAVGRLADRGHGPAVIQAGGFVAAGLLAIWAAVPNLITTYVVWALLGVCMSAILYEPVFAIVGRAIADPAGRMRAIATVTVMGGLASSAFLPGTAALVAVAGWRGAAAALAAIVGITTFIVGRIAFADLSWSAATIRAALLDHPRAGQQAPLPHLNRLLIVFAISSMVNSAIASNLVAALIDGGFMPALAATVAGLFGVMQLPGRLLMTSPTFAPSPAGLVVFSFVLQVLGLLSLLRHSAPALVAGVVIFAAGAGLTTLARPYWVLQRYGAARAGYANGLVARAQQIARAFGPVLAAAVAERWSYAAVFLALALMLGIATGVAWRRDAAPAPGRTS